LDSTPLLDEEFSRLAGQLEAVHGSPAADRVDLLSVVLHEMGHLLGHRDVDASLLSYDLMSGELAAGVRRTGTTCPVDAVFAGHW
jgi:hypothetical protein